MIDVYVTSSFSRLLRSVFAAVFAVAFFTLLITPARASSLVRPANNLGLLGYWSFEDGRGATATDFSGSGILGTLTDFALSTSTSNWTNGRMGKALDFDGVDDYVNMGTPTALQLQTFSASFWYKGTQTPDNGDSFISYVRNNGFADNGWDVGIDETGHPGQVYMSISNSILGYTTFSNFNNGSWHHLAFVNTGTSDHRLYVDGALDIYSTSTTSALDYTSTKFYVGARVGSFGSNTRFMPGTIDDVRVYNRALSATEVAVLYSSGQYYSPGQAINTVAPGNLVLWHTFDGPRLDTTTSTDSSGQGIDGALIGASGSQNKPQPTIGSSGQGLKFDGTDDYVKIATSISTSTSQTISLWFKQSSLAEAGIIETTVANSPQSSNPYLYVYANSGTLKTYASGGSPQYSTVDTYSANQWYHLAIVRTSATENTYLNGVLKLADKILLSTAGQNAQIDIGTGFHGYFNGSIDDVRIFNRALSASEVFQLYRLGGGESGVSRSSTASNLASGLILWHTFDGPRLNTSTSTDSSGQGNNGSLSGTPTPVNGKIGQALRFNASAFVSAPGTLLNAIEPNGSMATWFSFDSTWSSARTEDTYLWESERTALYNQIYLRFGPSDGRLIFGKNAADGANSPEEVLTTTSSWNAKQWYHAVFVWEGTAMRIYIDGVLNNSGTKTSGINSLGDVARIGNHRVGGLGFPGRIDDFRVYNRALSAAEVLQLYNAGK